MKKLLLGLLVLGSSLLVTPISYAQGCDQYLDLLCPVSKKITQCDKALILAYTRGLYIPLNEHLRKINVDKNCIDLSNNLVSALNKLQIIGKKVTYRGVRKLDKIQNLKIGDCFTDHGFVSTSLVEAGAMDYVRYEPEAALLEITSSSGRSISKYSDSPDEKEILLFPNTILKLEKRIPQSKRIEKFIFNEVKESECLIVKD